MSKKIYWLKPALDEIEDIRRYMAEEQDEPNPEFADDLVAAFFARVRILVDFPDSGPIVTGLRPLHRQLVVGKHYRILYRPHLVESDAIQIVAVIHTSRDLRKAWREKKRL